MRRYLVFALIILLAIITSSLYFKTTKKTFTETIANFPIDENIQYTSVKTSLQLVTQKDDDEYTIEWQSSSSVKDSIYLSHDISLLFEDGRLKKTMSLTKQKSREISQKVKIPGEDSGHYESISFHYGQVHYPNDITKSVQAMSYDQLYILDSPLSPIEAFKVAKTDSEKEGKRILDTVIQQNLQFTWQELADYFEIRLENYYPVPLTDLYLYQKQQLPKLSIDETKEMIAITWETLYKYYFLGMEKANGNIVSPLGSSVPLILYHQSYSHLFIIFTSIDGDKHHIIKQTDRF